MLRTVSSIRLFVVLAAAIWLANADCYIAAAEAIKQPQNGPFEAVTFNKDVAPILFRHCVICHRPDQSAPFSLLSYRDARKHDRQIAKVVERRYMPPWLPEHGFGDFAGERRLSADEIGIILRWVAQGAVEGDSADLPPAPRWEGGWQLGKPDLVLTMPQPYTLPAEGKDVYRNFVIPSPVKLPRYVKAVEFQPGNRKIVHHAFIKIDRTLRSRHLDAEDAEPGFAGMNAPVEMPGGHFLSWQPGKVYPEALEGLAWTLESNTDFVLQLHMNPTGKPESIQSSIGLYFTDRPPTNTPLRLLLTSYVIDIPPGETNYLVKDDYFLPVDVEVLAVLPHAHYLAHEMQGFATLPDGAKQWFLLIKHWNFKWQGDYRYAKPVFLPKGSVISMRFTYDNSTNNVQNPNQPPKRVRYGPQSSDEMAELWLQLLPRNRKDLDLLASDHEHRKLKFFRDYDEFLLRLDPADAKAHTELGMVLFSQGESEVAFKHLREAVRVRPDWDEPHYFLGVLLRTREQPAEAKTEFEKALQLNPKNHKACGNLGLIYLQEGNLDRAEFFFRAALKINPDDSLARETLGEILKTKTASQRGH